MDRLAPGANPSNLRGRVRLRLQAGRWLAAVASGLLLSAAFPPLEVGDLAWIAFLPLLLVSPPPGHGRRAALGYVFGLAHAISSLAWLNEIGFGAGMALAFFCALYPMLWVLISSIAVEAINGAETPGRGSGFRPPADPLRRGLVVLVPATVWVGLEWARSWIFTGFSWNQLGISQFQRLGLLQICTVTGVYGISFLIVAVNLALAMTVRTWIRHFRHGGRRGFPYELALTAILLLPAVWTALRSPTHGQPDAELRILAVQGNIPQIREWTPAQLDLALGVYTGITARQAPVVKPDLVVWPETAVPAALLLDEVYTRAMAALCAEIRTPLLIGSVDFREPLYGPDRDELLGFNSVFLIAADGSISDIYDKIHLVPFGEYTPLEQLWPVLTDWIGMGRSLTPGAEYTVFDLGNGIRGGVNICYEDAFPEISRAFTRRGANLLLTLTNDAWYAESAGSRQHLLHAVFRAVENRRPLFRSGNNSDTCLILPNGRVQGLLRDPISGSPFVRGAKPYTVPVWFDPATTFYTRHGDVFGRACGALTALTVLVLCGLGFRRRYRWWTGITGAAAATGPSGTDRADTDTNGTGAGGAES